MTDSLVNNRWHHTATLLPNGEVLVAGGYGDDSASAELYDSANGRWSDTRSLAQGRFKHVAILLPNGKVLVAGGSTDIPTSAELYDPASGTWNTTQSLATERQFHTATLLQNGKVLVAGGTDGTLTPVSAAEIYDTGLGFKRAWQPKITDLKFTSGKRLLLEGSLFQGISQASGGNTQDSSTNYPVVQVRSIDSSEVVFTLVDAREGWSDTSFSSLPLTHFPLGPALATVFTKRHPEQCEIFRRDSLRPLSEGRALCLSIIYACSGPLAGLAERLIHNCSLRRSQQSWMTCSRRQAWLEAISPMSF
jgi:WD40 repeat protein